MNNLKYFILYLVTAVVIAGCAKRATLSGGPKDTEPPKLLQNIKSSPNFQINFYPKTIKLYFDEWITLKNKNQILISPLMKNKPEINYRGKHITVEFNLKDTLKPNTTYIINFGNSIVDFTEGNPLKNFSYIFSTGDKIDSLSLSGIVRNAYDKKPVKGVKVMLYNEDRDSVVFNKLPYYFAETDDKGEFNISYMHEG
ncbi:MAG TPA: hypothetical protein ENK91_00340, partial [Bacteroidetes bacterium]|nr:hypothetical protein [Bacteroidota bacterium]